MAARFSPLAGLKAILGHTEPLPREADRPLSHFEHTSRDLWLAIDYVERNLRNRGRFNPVVLAAHLGRLNGMLLVHLIESLERFFKESAAACVDLLGPLVHDGRFDGFRVQGGTLAAHYGADTLGRALCEPMTWLDTASVNGRFRALLADPHEEGRFLLFPYGKKDDPSDRERFEAIELVWQLRHTVVHNVGVITRSDAAKLRLLVKGAVSSPVLLAPTREDIRHLKRFLDDTAVVCNERIGRRLAEVLTALHGADPTLFVPREMADRVSAVFGVPLAVAGAQGVVPPP